AFQIGAIYGKSGFLIISLFHCPASYYNIFTVEGTAASRVFFRIVA
ncbi:hypothetical protein HMPREF0239_01950, partial [Clostridium sp. ATCC BAA-442]